MGDYKISRRKEMMDVNVYKIAMSGPDDVSELKKLIKSGEIVASEIIAILGKTEGNGCVNDFTRGYCTSSFKNFVAKTICKTEKKLKKKLHLLCLEVQKGL